MTRLGAYLMAFLAACAPAPQEVATRSVPLSSSLADVKTFTAEPVRTPSRANAAIAQDFLDLTFRLESGREVPTLTRFEGPISVRVVGAASDLMISDLDQLLGRLRREANLNIAFAEGRDANITVEAIPRATLMAAVPNAACFVVPRVSSWAEFLRVRRTAAVDWTTLNVRDEATIFVPSDVAPQEVRDCLHEELAQALGPLNDLYRLPDSVFNDDNIHNVLTSFDMLILRLTYAPELANGMQRQEVAARLPSLLARMNPSGQHAGTPAPPVTDSRWIASVRTALSARETPRNRRSAAQQAVTLSATQGWGDTREAFAHYAYGRLQVGYDSERALTSFERADAIYRSDPATQIHSAHIAVQRAAFALSRGDAATTITIADTAIPEARSHQNAALLATLMMFKAEALALQGQTDAANALRLDSLGWARYGFGADIQVQARINEIAALRPS
ncbi:MAG: DUF2927 domain-containing protein [Pseudomonadota bacterium]